MMLLLLVIRVEKPKIFLLLQECFGLKSRYRRFIRPVHLELWAFYLAYEMVMERIHRVEFGSNISFPVPFDIMASNGLSLFAVCGAERFREVGNISLMLFNMTLFEEDRDDRGLKL